MSIRKRKRADGSTVYDVVVYMGFTRDGRRDRKSVTVKTKAAAEMEQAKLMARRDAMRNRSGRMRLADYIGEVYWPAAASLAASSKDTYEKEIRLRIVPVLGNMDVRDIDRAAIQRMVDSAGTEAVGKKAVGVLKTILNEAVADGMIATNPACARFAYPPKGRKRDNGLVLATFGEIFGLLGIVRERASESVQRIAYTGLLQGLRPEERYALDWGDLDMERKEIGVHGAYVTASRTHGGNQLKATKTPRGDRVVPMHPAFAEWLEGEERRDGAFILGAGGGRISPSTARHRWDAFLRDNPDAPCVTVENMRHSFATAYLHAGGSIEVLSRLLGHASIQTTVNRYYKPSTESLRDDLFADL